MTAKTDLPARTCCVCGRAVRGEKLIPAPLVQPTIAALIAGRVPSWGMDKFICAEDLNRFRGEYVRGLLTEEKGELDSLEKEVLDSLRDHDILSRDTQEDFEEGKTFGERLSDRIASFGGSWTFILSFMALVLAWMGLNTLLLLTRAFDPYPYILLNLILSCLAAIQAPVIMMSQKRQEARDRLRAMHDYQVNLKAELEIRHLHQKMDHLLSSQWERLVEIQEIQLDIMRELQGRK